MLANEPDARLLAGGATLVAMINADLASPDTLIALSGIGDLRGIAQQSDGSFRVGAMTLHRETASDDRLTGQLAVVREAAGVIANPVVRNMGTMGGAVAFADPAADYLPALAVLDATVELTGPDGVRRLGIPDFLVDWYGTAMAPGEILTAIHLPAPREGRGIYRKLARTSGDYAIASCAVVLEAGGNVRAAVGACGPGPVRDTAAEAELAGRADQAGAVQAFVGRLADKADPLSDVRGSAEYRRRLIPRIVTAALGELTGPRELAA